MTKNIRMLNSSKERKIFGENRLPPEQFLVTAAAISSQIFQAMTSP